MPIYLLIDGQQHGPYTQVQLRESLEAGQITGDIPAWHEGLDEWVTLERLFPTLGEVSIPISESQPDVNVEVPEKQTSINPVEPPRARTPLMPSNTRVPQNVRSRLKYLWLGAAIFCGLMLFGFSLGAGIVFGFAHSVAQDAATKGDVFHVYRPADEPDTDWYGSLRRSDGSVTMIIFDFGTGVTLASEDAIQGVFVPTEQIGSSTGDHYRIYKVQGSFKFVHPPQ